MGALAGQRHFRARSAKIRFGGGDRGARLLALGLEIAAEVIICAVRAGLPEALAARNRQAAGPAGLDAPEPAVERWMGESTPTVLPPGAIPPLPAPDSTVINQGEDKPPAINRA